jgi:peptidoglycan/LPS O-acetylase OafA/YrhL
MMRTARVSELDGLRGLAILAVMAFHFLYFPLSFGYDFGVARGLGVVRALLLSCWLGVDVFFVLSGFLLTKTMFTGQSGSRFWRDLYVRRLLRLFPLYFLLLALWSWWSALLPAPLTQSAVPGYGPWLWLFSSNIPLAVYGADALPKPLEHLWAPALGLQFYLLWPLICRRLNRSQLLRTCLGCILLCPMLRAILYWTDFETAALVSLPARLDAFAWGAILVLLPEQVRTWRRMAVLIGGAWMLVLLWALRGLRPEDPETLIFGLSLAAMLIAAALSWLPPLSPNGGWSRLLRLRPLTGLGKYSYGLYLIHQPLGIWLLASGILFDTLPGGWRESTFLHLGYFLLVPLVGALCLAVASWYLWERPFRQLQRRLR